MFESIKRILALRTDNKRRLKRISFLFEGGYYIFWRDKICKFNRSNIKAIGLIKSLFFFYHISKKERKEECLTDAKVLSGSFKHAVITESDCFLVFKERQAYYSAKKNYNENIDRFNYPCVRPTSFCDDLYYIKEPKASGRPLTTEDLPLLLKTLLLLFGKQEFVRRDGDGVLFYVQHDDALPGNSWSDERGELFFVDIDNITERAALSDFFNVILRSFGFDYLLKSAKTFENELKEAFRKHDVEYNESIFDLYLSKFIEMRISSVRSGYNNGILYKSIEWILDPVVEKIFPMTNEIIKKYKFTLTADGYKVE